MYGHNRIYDLHLPDTVDKDPDDKAMYMHDYNLQHVHKLHRMNDLNLFDLS